MNKCQWQKLNPTSYSVFFMRGRGSTQMPLSQRSNIRSLINKNPYSDSFMLYNSTAIMEKAKAWKTRLPWIKPFYAMKSNPMPRVIKDAI